jgi:hypothetical protein
MCYNGACDRNRKSIRRDQIEGAFVALLDELTPKPQLAALTKAMFKSAWKQRTAQAAAIASSYRQEVDKVDAQIAKTLDRMVEASSATVIGAFEKRVEELERSKACARRERPQRRSTSRLVRRVVRTRHGLPDKPFKILAFRDS